jgi:hypothetical protein
MVDLIRATTCFLCGLVLLGCMPSLAAVSAGQVGCPVHEVVVDQQGSNVGWNSRTDTWRASCRGRVFQCSMLSVSSQGGASSSAVCTPMASGGEAPPAGEAVASTVAPAPAPDPVHVDTNAAGHRVISAELEEGRFHVRLVSVPAEEPHRVLIVFAMGGTVQSNAQCPVGLLVDGTVIALAGATYTTRGHVETWHGHIDDTVAGTLGTGHRVVGRVCELEWRPSSASQLVIDEWNARRTEELAWVQSNPGAAAPATSQVAP